MHEVHHQLEVARLGRQHRARLVERRAGAGEGARIAFGRFASELGLLFQIVDDILDVTGSEAEMGKPSGTDERLGKRTYVSVFGLERAHALAAATHTRARAALDAARAVLPAEPRDLELMTDFMYGRNS